MVYITVRKSLRTSDQSEIQADHDQHVIFWPKEHVKKWINLVEISYLIMLLVLITL